MQKCVTVASGACLSSENRHVEEAARTAYLPEVTTHHCVWSLVCTRKPFATLAQKQSVSLGMKQSCCSCCFAAVSSGHTPTPRTHNDVTSMWSRLFNNWALGLNQSLYREQMQDVQRAPYGPSPWLSRAGSLPTGATNVHGTCAVVAETIVC